MGILVHTQGFSSQVINWYCLTVKHDTCVNNFLLFMSEAMALWLKLNLSYIRNKDLFLCVRIILNSENQYQPYKGNANNFILQWPETSRVWSHDVFMVYLELTITHFPPDRLRYISTTLKAISNNKCKYKYISMVYVFCFVCKFAFHSFWYFTPTLRKQIKMWSGIISKVAKLRKKGREHDYLVKHLHGIDIIQRP